MRGNKALTPRLAAAAVYAREGTVVADIGTDHALLAIYLANHNHRVYACDLNAGPLNMARKAVERAGLEERIAVIQSDGLKDVPPDAQDIFIMGMGGGLIAGIIGNGLNESGWDSFQNKRLILSPTSHADILRRFLCENSFEVLHESLVVENDRLSVILCAEYNLFQMDPFIPNDFELAIGRYIIKNKPEHSQRYAKEALNREHHILSGLIKGNVENEKTCRTKALIERLEQFIASVDDV